MMKTGRRKLFMLGNLNVCVTATLGPVHSQAYLCKFRVQIVGVLEHITSPLMILHINLMYSLMLKVISLNVPQL